MQSLLRRFLRSQTDSKPDRHPIISSAGHISLVPISEDDHDLVAQWFTDSESCRLAFGVDTDLSTLQSMTYDYLSELRNDSSGVLMIFPVENKTSTSPLGFLRYKLFRKDRRNLARVGILLGHAEHRGRGLGTESMMTLLAYLFERRSVNLVELDTAHFNVGAQNSFLKCGFKTIRETEIIGLRNGWKERRIIMRLTAEEWKDGQD